jgi:hypothetical protein
VSFDPNRPITPQPFTPVAPEPGASSGMPTGPVATSPVMAAPPAIVVAKKKGSGGWLNIVLVIAAAVAIGGVAFAAGRTTAPVSASVGNGRGGFGGAFPGGSFAPRASGQPGFGGRGGFGGGFGGGLTVSGTVESMTADSITIKTASGQTVTVATGASTTYNSQAPASASDVQTGKSVQVQLDLAGGGRPSASATTSGPVGTAGSVTVLP